MDVLDHRERGPQPQRERGHDPQSAQTHGGRREALVALPQRHQLPVRGEQLDLVDLLGKAAEAPATLTCGSEARLSSAHPAACSRGQSSP